MVDSGRLASKSACGARRLANDTMLSRHSSSPGWTWQTLVTQDRSAAPGNAGPFNSTVLSKR